MSASPTPSLESVANQLKVLSTSLPVGSDSVYLKNVLRENFQEPLIFNSTGICDKVYELAKERVIVEQYSQLITTKQITTFSDELKRESEGTTDDKFVSIEKLYQILSRSPQTLRKCFSSAVINKLVMYSGSEEGCVSSQILSDFLVTCCRRSRQVLLVQSVAKATDYITSDEFIDFVMSKISNKLTWVDEKNDFPYYYAVFIERYVFFHLDPLRTGKLLTQVLTSTTLFDDLFEILSDQKRSDEEYEENYRFSWCSLSNFWRVLAQFRKCDESWSGMLCLEECYKIRDGAFTPLFLNRVFATQKTYCGLSFQEMDFRGFVELDVAFRTRDQPASIKWLFRVLDLRDDGYLDRYEIKLMTESMLKNMTFLEGWSNYNADDIVDEIFDMLNPTDQERISLHDVLNSGMAETAFGILIDYTTFLKFESREDEAAS